MYAPYVKQEEPLKVECQHFVECIRNGASPLTSGRRGLQVVRILEAASQSLKQGGAEVLLPDNGAPMDSPSLWAPRSQPVAAGTPA